MNIPSVLGKYISCQRSICHMSKINISQLPKVNIPSAVCQYVSCSSSIYHPSPQLLMSIYHSQSMNIPYALGQFIICSICQYTIHCWSVYCSGFPFGQHTSCFRSQCKSGCQDGLGNIF
jgi:hypothetical protein